MGCGEGQVARLARSTGARVVVGLDPTRAQIAEATRRGGAVRYVLAAASAVPVVDSTFDAVVACLVLEHIRGYREAVGEVARVLAPGGRFLLFLNHPLLQAPGSGWIDDRILGEQYWRIGPYLAEHAMDEEVVPGVVLPFVHRPLSAYVNAMAEHGLAVEHMEEPPPPAGFLARAPEYRDAALIPRLLFVRAVKLRGASRRPARAARLR